MEPQESEVLEMWVNVPMTDEPTFCYPAGTFTTLAAARFFHNMYRRHFPDDAPAVPACPMIHHHYQ